MEKYSVLTDTSWVIQKNIIIALRLENIIDKIYYSDCIYEINIFQFSKTILNRYGFNLDKKQKSFEKHISELIELIIAC